MAAPTQMKKVVRPKLPRSASAKYVDGRPIPFGRSQGRIGLPCVAAALLNVLLTQAASPQEVNRPEDKAPSAKQLSEVKQRGQRRDELQETDLQRFEKSRRLQHERPSPATALDIKRAELEDRYEFPDFRSGEERRSVQGRLETSLAVIYGERKMWRPATFDLKTGAKTAEAGVIDTRLRSYDGLPVGPTLRVKAGDVLRIRLSNLLPVEKPKEHAVNTPDEFNRTNLHTHGLHVTPVGNGDNVLLEVRPGETHVVEVAIPRDHVPGTFWYHSHVHGSTAIQVSSGMAGALIVEPRDDDRGSLEGIPEIKNAEERVCVFQQLSFHAPKVAPSTGSPVYEVEDFAAAFNGIPADQFPVPPPSPLPSRWEAGETRDGWRTTINGQLQPVIRVQSGRLQRFRFIHGGVRQVINVQLAPVQVKRRDGRLSIESRVYDVERLNEEGMREIAVDGIPLERMRRATTVQLYPGYRSDVLTRLVNTTNEPQYYVMWDGVTGNDFSLDPSRPGGPDWTKRTDVLAIIEVAPAKDDKPSDPWPSEQAFAAVRRPAPIPEHEVVGLQMAKLAVGGGFKINDLPYDPKAEPLKLKLGRADEWKLTSTGAQAHPFHIHVNPFFVVSETDNATGVSTPVNLWRDTLLVDGRRTYTFRTRYENYLGDFVIHCHLLDHEDQGMMQGIRVVNSAYEVGTKIARPYWAPRWELPDETGAKKSLDSLLGKRATILVFLESQSCAACNVQLQLYKDRKADLPADVNVVFVAPQERGNDFPGPDYPFPVVFDNEKDAAGAYKLDQYKAYNVYLSQHRVPLHGTFVLDPQGRVRWREVSDRPFVDLDTLLRDIRLIQ